MIERSILAIRSWAFRDADPKSVLKTDVERRLQMVQKTRRVVTGHDANQRSIFIMDGDAPNVRVFKHYGGTAATELWQTDAVPADNTGHEDAAEGINQLEPRPGGTVFRIVEYPPDKIRFSNIDRDAAFREMGARHAMVEEGARNPGMHKTDTVDYAVVLSGEIYAVMDEGELLLKAGDCLVQRGTSHAWSNRTDEPCRIAFVLVDAKPLSAEIKESD